LVTAPVSSFAPLVGRDHELAILREKFAAAQTGNGGLVLIGGEAGIGKTALADALCREAAERDALVLMGRCYDLTETPPYGPWVELFARYRQRADTLPLPEAFARRGSVGDVASQVVLFHQLRDFFTTLSENRPLVLLFDDLHWADSASLDLLRFLARAASMLPLLILATYRADELTHHHPLLVLLPLLEHEAHAARLDLRPLSTDAIRVFVATRYRLPDADAARLVAYCHARTDGNAFFLVQLLRALEEDAVLRQADGRWELGDLAAVGLPMPLRQVIDARVVRLGEEGQRFLRVAAIIGQVIPVGLWTAVAATDDETVLDLIDRACEMHILQETTDGGQVRFAHALVRDALYVGITGPRRRRLHQQIAEAMASLPHPDPDAVAYHFRQAEDPRAAGWLVRAGERAQRALAWITAAERYQAALAHMQDGGADPRLRGWLCYRVAVLRRFTVSAGNQEYLDEAAHLAAEAHDAVLAANVRYYQGMIRPDNLDADQMLDNLAAGVAALAALAPAEGRTSGLFERVDPHGARGSLILRLARVGRFAEAFVEGERWITEVPAREAHGEDLGASPDAPYGLGIAHAHLGHVEAAAQSFARARVQCEATHHYPVLGGVLADTLRLLALRYHPENHTGRLQLAEAATAAWERAAEMSTYYPPRFAYTPLLLVEGGWDEARALASTVYCRDDYAAKEHASAILAPLALAQGDGALLATLIAERLPGGPETEPGKIYYNLVLLQVAAAWAMTNGDLTTARAWLEAHDRWLAWSGAILGRSEGEGLWSQYYRDAGNVERAERHVQEALVRATKPRQPLALLAAYRKLGELDTTAGRFTDATGHLTTALALADRCAAPYERALTLLAMAALHAATNQDTDARTLLDEVRAICVPLDARPALARVDALLEEFAAVPPAASRGLTAREVEVLRLLASGLTIKQIAADLFLSPRTVERHITTIYRKIDARGRVDATAWAVHTGLLTGTPGVR
jgi:DNA-binding CsgD family transcriptional regulator